MFCCSLARNRLRGVGFVGAAIVAGICTYWFSRYAHKMYLFHGKEMVPELVAYLVGDAVTGFFLFFGSVLLLFAAARPPARVLSSSDIYDGSARPFSGNKRAALLSADDDIEAGLAGEDPTSPRAVYFAAYERIGVANPASPAAWLGRFFVTIACSAMIAIGAVRVVSLFDRRVFTKRGFYAKDDVPDILIAILPIVYSICALIVVLLADPGRLPPPPREVLSPSTGSDSRYRAARVRGGAFGADDASYDSSLPRPGVRGSANGMSSSAGVDNTEFFSNAALQSSYARQSNRAY